MSTKSILLLGPRYNKRNPHIVGGPIVLFEELIKQLSANEVKYRVIDTNKKNYSSPIQAYLSIFFQLLFKSASCTHLSLHSSRDYMLFGGVVILIGKLFGKKTSLRKFGGEAAKTYTESFGVKKLYLNLIFSKVDKLYLETKYLVTFFCIINKNTFWFPNVRNRAFEPSLPREFKKRFVFISHVIKEKGIDEIIEASKHLDSSYTVDIYGPIMHQQYTEKEFAKGNALYKGALVAGDVLKKLNEYDVVLLPSYKEGYPGIIIEAYSLGIPVVATTLQSISEIVNPYETGMLVKPKSVDELVRAIKYFNKENYGWMSKKAYAKFDDFRSDLITKQFLETLEN